MLRSAWDLLTLVVATTPPWFVPVFLSWAISVMVTQAVKAASPDGGIPCRNLFLRAVAASSAVVTCWALWSDTGLPAGLGFVTGLAVGLWSPLSWAIFTRAIGARWPHLRDALADDGRTKTE